MAKTKTKNENNQQKQTMSREEAGRMGGKAPHVCRGRQCSEDTNNKKKETHSKHINDKDHNNDSWFF